MKKGRNLFRLSVLGLLVLSSLPLLSQAGGPEVQKEQPFNYMPRFTTGPFYTTTNSSWFGLADVFVPFTIDNNSVVFIDGRYYDRKGDESETNIGAGFRQIVNNSFLVTGYGFYDTRTTRFNNDFQQVTIGGDLQTENWYFGINGYLEVGRTVANVSAFNFAQLSGNYIYYGPGIEKSMGGADAEVGYTIPRTHGLTFYAGVYGFGAPGVQTAVGPNLRLEYAYDRDEDSRILWLFDKVTFEVNWRDDKLAGSNWFTGIRFDIGIGPQPELTGLERKMTSFIRRDLNVEMSSDGKDGGSLHQPTRVLRKSNGDRVFVSSVNGASGTAEADFNAAVANLNTDIVAVNGAVPLTATTTTLRDGETVEGGVYGFSRGGQDYSVRLGTNGGMTSAVGGGPSFNYIELGSNNVIENMAFANTAGAAGTSSWAIEKTAGNGSMGDVVVRNNTATNMQLVGVAASGANTLSVYGNTVTTTSGNTNATAVIAISGDPGGTTTVNIYGNTINSNGNSALAYGINLNAVAATNTINALIQNNSVTTTNDSVRIEGPGAVNIIGNFSNNTFHATGAALLTPNAMLISGTGQYTFQGDVRNNTFETDDTGVNEGSFMIESTGAGHQTNFLGVVEGNTFINNSATANTHAFYVEGNAATTSIGFAGGIINNTFNSSAVTTGLGLFFDAIGAGTTIDVTGLNSNRFNTVGTNDAEFRSSGGVVNVTLGGGATTGGIAGFAQVNNGAVAISTGGGVNIQP